MLCLKHSRQGIPGQAVPEHDRRCHFGVTSGHPSCLEFDFIIDRPLDKDTSDQYTAWLDRFYPWSLENCTQWMFQHGYKVVWMSRARMYSGVSALERVATQRVPNIVKYYDPSQCLEP
jgi:hypothetical protein